MSDSLLAGIGGFLSMTWDLLMSVNVPGTGIPFGVFFVGLALIPIGFRFLSIALGFSIGQAQSYGHSNFTERSKRK